MNDAARDAELDRLIAACLERFEQVGETALDEFVAEHPEHADVLQRRIVMLRDTGMLTAPGEASAASDEQTIPDRLGSFQILRCLGGGGMGVVYLAVQEELGREVALKLVRPDQMYFPRTRERFRREIEVISKLQHPGIVPIYAVGEEDGVPYFAMERVRGCTLHDVLQHLAGTDPNELTGRDLAIAVKRCSDEEDDLQADADPALGYVFSGSWEDACLRLVRQIAEALEHAHRRDVVHRDIKPSNVMVTPSGRAMMLDFGLAGSESTHSLTRTGSKLGSLHHMAPEQSRGDTQAVGPRTDIYALGVTLYELLTLTPAFRGEATHEIARAIELGAFTPVRRRNTAVSWESETVCHRAMALEPGERYATAVDFARDLDNVLDRRPIDARRAGAVLRLKRWAQRNPAIAVGCTLGLIAVIGGAIGYAVIEHDARERIAEKHARAERNFERATRAVNTMLTKVGDETLRNIPQMEAVRRDLLLEALASYQEFLADSVTDPDLRAETGRIHCKIATLQFDLHETESALTSARSAITIFEQLGQEHAFAPSDRSELALARRVVADVLEETGDLADADQERLTAINELERSRDDNTQTTDETVLLAQLRHARGTGLRTSAPDEAESEFRAALAIMAELIVKHPDRHEYRAIAARGRSQLAASRGGRGHHKEALQLHTKSVEDFDQLLEAVPDQRIYRRHLAIALYNQSMEFGRADRFDEALASCRRVEKIWVREIEDFPRFLEYRSLLAVARSRIATLLARRGETTAAITILEANNQDLRALVAEHPTNIEFRFNLALGVSTLCTRLLREREFERALRSADDAAELLAELARNQPSDAEFHFHLGRAFAKRGSAREELGDLRQACDDYQLAISEQLRVRKLVFDHQAGPRNLRSNIWKLANCRIDLGQHREAATAGEEFVSNFPDQGTEWRRAAEVIARCAWLPEDDDTLALEAQQAAARSYDERAFELLRGAVERGFDRFESLQKAPTLARVRTLPGFEAWFRGLVND